MLGSPRQRGVQGQDPAHREEGQVHPGSPAGPGRSLRRVKHGVWVDGGTGSGDLPYPVGRAVASVVALPAPASVARRRRITHKNILSLFFPRFPSQEGGRELTCKSQAARVRAVRWGRPASPRIIPRFPSSPRSVLRFSKSSESVSDFAGTLRIDSKVFNFSTE